MFEEIKIRPPYIKLSALLKFTGEVLSGGEAKCLITEGKIRVNGEACVENGKKLYPGDEVQVGEKTYVVKLLRE